jgi:uncharacterized protein (TIGR03382 family)
MDIPLGSYPNTLTPWGLLDTSGGTAEWTEETFFDIYHEYFIRWADGSFAGRFSALEADLIGDGATEFPESMSWDGLRIASTVPATPASALFGVAGAAFLLRRRRSR